MAHTLLFAQWRGQKYNENVSETVKMTEKRARGNKVFLDEEALWYSHLL
jgi:hypothetical protein